MQSDGSARPFDPADLFGRADVALPDAGEAAAADAAAREQHDVPERLLMDNAGRAAALVVHALSPRGRFAVVTGAGNNGGDGCVVARSLHVWGRDVCVVPAGRPARADLLHGVEVPIVEGDAGAAAIANADVVVDAVLGTGARGAPRPPAAAWLRHIAAAAGSGRTVVALDLPSGVDASTGHVHGGAVRAALTIAFGWPKLGLMLHPARAHCGRIVAVEIGFPPAVAAPFAARLITPHWAAARLPRRAPDAHKGSAGRLLLVAGSRGMAGAAVIAAQAASAAGTGYLRVLSAAANRGILQARVPEALFHTPADLDSLDPAAIDALAIGPGLGAGDRARALLLAVLRRLSNVPAVIDADALNLYAADADVRAAVADRPAVLTPHPGEMGRLLDVPTADVTADAVAAVRAAAGRFRAVMLLKGQPTLIAAPGEPLLVGTTGSSDLATAGMGDQLTGVIGALLAAGSTPRDAAGTALFYAGRAADLARRGRSLTPGIVSRHMARAFRDPGALAPPAGLPFVTFDQPART